MSHNGIQEYTKDFNYFTKCYFDKGDLSIVGYQQQLLRFYKQYKEQGKDYFEQFLKSTEHIQNSAIEHIFALSTELFDQATYKDHLVSLLVQYRSVITFNFLKDINIADEILQLADHLNCIEHGLGGKALCYLNLHLSTLPQWLKDYGISVLEEGNDNL